MTIFMKNETKALKTQNAARKEGKPRQPDHTLMLILVKLKPMFKMTTLTLSMQF
jgi:hypothetical protein